MRVFRVAVVSSVFAVLLSGCITVSQYRFSLDLDTGEIIREYYNVTSRQGVDEKDYSVTKDWSTLKEMISDQKPEFDAEVIEDIFKGLFQDKEMLCARKTQKVKCPKCFPSAAALLSYVHDEDWRFELINGEVVVVLPSSKRIISTNGQSLTTAKNSFIIWPQETRKFEYFVAEQWSGGTSLLPSYLEEERAKK